MNDKKLVERDLSPEEKATLLAHTKWTECPMCEGQPPRNKPGAFCVLCGNEGKVTNGTRDVTAHLRLSYQHSFERIEALQSRIEALEAALRDAPAALNAMAAQVEAELRDHDKAAARHDLVVQTFRKKVRDALESKP